MEKFATCTRNIVQEVRKESLFQIRQRGDWVWKANTYEAKQVLRVLNGGEPAGKREKGIGLQA
jgi:hypothetical protein